MDNGIDSLAINGKIVVLFCTEYVRRFKFKEILFFDAHTLLAILIETNKPS